MFEFSIAKGYLWPKRKRLSLSLISIMSVFVISLVIWLLLLFLSITEGIEKNWLHKLTSLNSPIRIVPTNAYYDSYYFQIDSISSHSGFQYKSIGEKLRSPESDPYDPEIDEEIPFYWPKRGKQEVDLVKCAAQGLDDLKKDYPDLTFQDYEVAGALMKLRLIRSEGRSSGQSFITQASYIASFADQNPKLGSLIKPPSMEDLNHLIYLSTLSDAGSAVEDRPQFVTSIGGQNLKPITLQSILNNITLEAVRINGGCWTLPSELLPMHAKLQAYAYKKGRSISYFVIPLRADETSSLMTGTLKRTPEGLSFTSSDGCTVFKEDIPLFLGGDHVCKANFAEMDLTVNIDMNLQGNRIRGLIPWSGLQIEKAKVHTSFDKAPNIPPPWAHEVAGRFELPNRGILIPTQFRENRVNLGDEGYLAYNATTPTASVELRNPVFVAGFYDPGIMSIGAKVLLAAPDTVRAINAAGQSISVDPLMTNGLSVWFSNLGQTDQIVALIKKSFKERGIDPYWKVVPFHEYDFARDLIMQFKSDRYLFVIIGIIILMVACCNIISQLLLLVNDKKQEIGILLSLGAKKRSIALIFGLCGVSMGIISCVLGTLAAYFTLANIDSLVHLLNLIEGQVAFNAAFYGQSLPNQLSYSAFSFIVIVTPTLSFVAGLIPAIKACRLKPVNLLRSE